MPKQLFYRHVGHDPIPGCKGGGALEITVGPYTPGEAKIKVLEHRAADPQLGQHAPKNCYAAVQPYAWKYADWGGVMEKVEVCTPGCTGCRHGYHNEVRDAS